MTPSPSNPGTPSPDLAALEAMAYAGAIDGYPGNWFSFVARTEAEIEVLTAGHARAVREIIRAGLIPA